MAKFLPGISCKNPVSVQRKNVFWMVDFDLPDTVRENKSISELESIHGVFCMGFYADPLPGDLITYRGYQWRVTARHFNPYRHSERAERQIPLLSVEFLGEAP